MKGNIILTMVIVLLACCTSSTKEKKTTHNHQNIKSNQLQSESFPIFVNRFHSDSVFQVQRIAHEVGGYNSDEDDTHEVDSNITHYLWDKANLAYYLQLANRASTDSAYRISYEKESENCISEKIYIPDSGCFYILTFSKKKGQWYMSEFINHQL